MNYEQQLAEGKTKIIYADPADPARAIMVHKDSISAGDGARRNVIPGKGALSGRTAANVFSLLNRSGIATHFLGAPDAASMLVQRCQMIPVEVVMRRVATGSYLRRHPEAAEGDRFEPPLVEFFIKDDARHDPQISPEEMVSQAVASADEVEAMQREGIRVFETLERAWAAQEITLVDLKIEFGRPLRHDEPPSTNERAGLDGRQTNTDATVGYSALATGPSSLLVADMIDNDSWRLWPSGDKSRMLDKQVYRNMSEVTDQGLDDVRQLYETVATLTDGWR